MPQPEGGRDRRPARAPQVLLGATMALVPLAVLGLVAWRHARDGNPGEAVTIAVAVGVTVLATGLFVAVRLSRHQRAYRTMRDALRALRPDGALVLGMQTTQTWRDAKDAGASTTGIRPRLGGPMAVVRTGDALEVWFPRERRPRWRLRWRDDGARAVPGTLPGGVQVPVLEISDGTAAVHLLPHFLEEDLSGTSHEARVTEALRLLGVGPALDGGSSGSGRQFELPT